MLHSLHKIKYNGINIWIIPHAHIYIEWQKVLSLMRQFIDKALFSGRVELERTIFICPRRYEPHFRPFEDRYADIVREMLHDPWGVKYDVSSFHEILTGPSR